MDRRQKDIVTMAELAELTAVRTEKRSSRQFITCRADNGVEREFSISLGSKSDARGDQNELSVMKRFARENAAPSPQPTKRNTLTMAKPTSKSTTSQLSPVDFYKVCEWLKAQALPTFPNLEALALGAAKHIGSSVSEADVTTAMSATSISEPAHWAEPTDPQTIVVRELLNVMKDLGASASPAFAALAAKLLPSV